MPLRLLFSIVVCCLALLPSTASASGVVDSLNVLRAEHGLEAVAHEPALDPVASEVSIRDEPDPRAFERREAGDPSAVVCRLCPLAGGLEPDGEGRSLGHGLVRTGWGVERSLRAAPELAVLALDPRLAAIGVAESGVTTTVVFAVDPRRPFGERLIVFPRPLEVSRIEQLRIIAPAPVAGRLVIRERPGKNVALGLGVLPGLEGAVVAGFGPAGPRPQLAYSHDYGVALGALSSRLRTAPAPRRVAGAPRVVGGTARERARIRAALRHAPGPIRRLVSSIGASLTFRVGEGTCGAFASCAWPVEDDRVMVSILRAHLKSPEGRFVVYHELAHALDLLLLDRQGRRAISRAMRGSPRFGCVINPAQVDLDIPRSEWCLGDSELFADEFARWAVGDRRATGGYSTVPLLPPRTLRRLIERHATPRPVSLRGWQE